MLMKIVLFRLFRTTCFISLRTIRELGRISLPFSSRGRTLKSRVVPRAVLTPIEVNERKKNPPF